jgi:glycyl-tRNA synthetase
LAKVGYNKSNMAVTMEKIISLAKRRGFIFPSSEIYGGLEASYDFGPLGAELARNIKNLWWQEYVLFRPDIVGLDCAIFMNPQVWEASGHTKEFFDEFLECQKCHQRFRKDYLKGSNCPDCGGDLGRPQKFQLMLETFWGPVKDSAHKVYLRPETAQGIFVNFKIVQEVMRLKIPFGIAQIGKAFRNEITVGNFIFRKREFEQMEIEWFCHPKEADKWHKKWVKERLAWYQKYACHKDNFRKRAHRKDELAHYAKASTDIEFKFPWGWDEIEGIANRQDFDLKQHQKYSKKDLTYTDDKTGQEYLPYVIEPSAGLERPFLAFLLDAYEEEEVKGEKRIVLKLHPALAPVKVAVFPLKRNETKLVKKAKAIFKELKEHFPVMYDDTGSIGRLYRRQDEIGTPFCITVDFETLEKDDVTVRWRDTMEQERVPIAKLVEYLRAKLWKTC